MRDYYNLFIIITWDSNLLVRLSIACPNVLTFNTLFALQNAAKKFSYFNTSVIVIRYTCLHDKVFKEIKSATTMTC